MPPGISDAARRRILALAGDGNVGSVHDALAYACRLLNGSGVDYIWHEADIANDGWNGVSYVQRNGLPTVAYDWRKQKFIWRYKP